MPRWISFDDAAATALRERGIEANAVWADLDPLSEVLRTQAAVLVLPTGRGDVLVAQFRRAAALTADATFEVARWTDDNPVGYTAGGMLGLRDEPVYEEDAPPKKKWWQRILE